MSDYDYGDDEHHDDDSGVDSDDENFGFVPAKRRFQYTTFGDEKQESEEEDGKDAATYGVFLHGDGEPRRKRPRTSSAFSTTPMFVKGETEKSKDGEQAKEPTPDSAAAKSAQQAESKDEQASTKQQEEDTEKTKLEELERRKEQEAANARFYELLGRGRGTRQRRSFRDEEPAGNETHEEPTGLGAGLGFQASGRSDDDQVGAAPGLGMPYNFGIGMKPPSPPVRVDPNLGKWEKHTKGIGMKLLTKMGYKGSGGLGAKRIKKKESGEVLKEEKRTGISRPVEVVVRPANLGLGFGNFKEATKLKVNKQIEAEVRGVEVPKKKQKEDGDLAFQGSGSSALPTTQELLQQQSWKKGARHVSRKRQRTVVPYTELLEKQKQPVIIDMRGPAATEGVDVAKKEVPLAEELLHNVTILLNTYENKIHSSSHFVQSTGRKVQSLKSDVDEMDRRMRDGEDRIAKLQTVLRIIDDIEAILDEDGGATKDGTINKAQSLIRKLGESFGEEERIALRFDEVFAPSLLTPIIQARLDSWEPLRDSASTTEQILASIMRIGGDGDDQSALSMKRTIFTNHVLPRVKLALESTKWKPMVEVESAIQLVEAVLATARDEFPSAKQPIAEQNASQVLQSDDLEEERVDLVDRVKREVIFDVVLPKLSLAVSQWEPSLDERRMNIQHRLDLWILPWIQLLDHPTLLPQLMTDCRRKLRSALSYLQRSMNDDEQFFHVSITMLQPWSRVIKTETLQELTSKYISTRLSRFISQQPVTRSARTQNWSGVDIVFQCHGSGILSDLEFLSLIEGSVLGTRWLTCIYDWLATDEEIDQSAFVDFYMAWKTKLLESENGQELLSRDTMICRMLYSGIFLAHTAKSSASLRDYVPSPASFQVVLARRVKEERRRTEEELRRMEYESAPLNGAAARRPMMSRRMKEDGATFRDVVEDFARERNVSFLPKMGANSFKDGKQVFLFGKVPIYLDSNVVFALQETKWRPISLDQLATLA